MTANASPTDKSNESSGRIIARVLLTTLKFTIIPILCIVALIVGLAIGYVVLGDKPLSDVFDLRTWKHMYDLVFAAG